MTIKRRTTKRKVTTKKKLVRRKSTKSKVRKCPTCGGLTRVSIKRKAKGKWDDDPKDTDDKEDDLENIRDYPIKKAIRERRESEKERETESRKEIGRRYRESHGY